jgi:hypothetical protein
VSDIYDIDFNLQADNLNPPSKRLPKITAFLKALMKPLQWLRDSFFDDYVQGQQYSAWSSGTTYSFGDRVTYTDRGNYEYINETASSGNLPTDEDYWYKIQDVYLGLNERSKYNAQKIMLERVLNTYFNTSPTATPDIYIDNNDTFAQNFVTHPLGSGNTVNVYSGPSYQDSFVFSLSYVAQTNCFTVNVPIALSNALTSEAPDSVPNISDNRESIIKALIDKYNTASVGYNIVTY